MKKKMLWLFLMTVALMLTGCAAPSADQAQMTSDEASQMQTETEGLLESAETQEIIQEVPYMQQFENNITELMPEGAEAERESIIYPEFEKYTYFSTTAGRDTNVNVLLPPDYSEDKEYPVLYIMHGFYDNETWMARPVVALNMIYNNLLADGEAREMIIVLPYIFCDKDMPYCTGMDLKNCLAYDNFINDLTTDLMPFIESEFSVAKGRENTAITGFSMGGRESLFIGFERPDLFGYIGAVCPAPGLVEVPNSPMHPGQMAAEEMTFPDNEPFVVFVSSSESDGVVGNSPDSYRAIMTENGVKYLSHVMECTGHDHTSVKPHLYNFLKMLFK
ncbi:MAG: esterase family protein [Oscillospiraceae bacterium]|nr:esterase family protein [Oscillospiraceae bacterium]